MSSTSVVIVDQLDQLHQLDLPPGPLCVLLAIDATDLSVEQIVACIEHLLQAGMVYLCVWGADTERMHEIADEVVFGDGDGPSPWQHVVTTWDAADSLSNAATFARHEAIPEGASPEDDFVLLGIAVGEPDWARRMGEVFAEVL